MTFFTKEKITEIRIITTLFVVGAFALLIYGIIMTTKAKKELLYYEFSGVVNKITYCKKEIPEVTIMDEVYYLDDYIYTFRGYVKIGDSLAKYGGEHAIYLYRKDSSNTYVLNNILLTRLINRVNLTISIIV